MTDGPMPSDASSGNNGVFVLPGDGTMVVCVCSDEGGWDHVSVHVDIPNGLQRTPTWDEMVTVKQAFFKAGEWAVEYHPGNTAYVSMHPHTLHLWRSQRLSLPTPPQWMV